MFQDQRASTIIAVMEHFLRPPHRIDVTSGKADNEKKNEKQDRGRN
jgi:hypothetical protein